MAKRDEVSSTERLLDLIRDDSESDYSAASAGSGKSFGHRLKNLFNNPVSFRKIISIGVDLGHEDIKMVKISRISSQKYEMLEYERIPFEDNIDRSSPQFPQFLRTVLTDFCGNSKSLELWCTISSARVETRQIRIPKVNQKQIPNSVYWSYKKISSFDEAKNIFDFELLGEVEEAGRPKIDVMAYTAPQQEIKDLKDTFSKAGYPLTGISIVPFAFQSILRAGLIETDEANVSSLYIGRDWSRIDIFSEGNLMLSRGIKAGVKTMIEALRTEIEGNLFELSVAKSPTKDSARIRAIKKKLKNELEQAHQLFFGVIHDSAPSVLDERQRLLKEDKIFKMILPALERLVRQVERTLRHFSLNFDNARVGKIYISSGVSPHQRIVDYIGEELGIPTEILNPFADSANFISLAPSPDEPSEQSSYVPAMGMSLSSNTLTPNFLYTYKDKQKAVQTQWINRGISASAVLLMLLCVGVFLWQGHQVGEKEYKLLQLQRQLENVNLRVDKSLILKLVDETQAHRRQIKGIGQKYFGVAVISELTQLTPPNVRLISISTKLGNAPAQKKGKKGKKKASRKKTLVLDGIVRGDRLILESTLAGYLMELRNSPIFDQPKISKKSFERYKEKDVLRFTARLKLL
ncbi:MAG: pilus assembly protein PilM [Deltaproteobacteria bacterium]|nr:pilus assembly protein PilM [Deltaproteobacteria bacterium]